MKNNMLRANIDWKKVCIIVAIMCLVSGFIAGKVSKVFASDIQQLAKPYVPNKSVDYNNIVSATFSLSDGDTINIGSWNYDNPVSYYNLNISYKCLLPCFATFSLQYTLNGTVRNEKITRPLNMGEGNSIIKNWIPKNCSVNNIQCIDTKVILMS